MNYIDLSSKSFEIALDATTKAANRVLGYVKSNVEVLAKPIAATTPEAFANESIERASKLVELRDGYLKETNKHVAAFAGDVLTNAKAWQDSVQSVLKGFGDITASNLNFVKETTAQQIDGLAKHVSTASKN